MAEADRLFDAAAARLAGVGGTRDLGEARALFRRAGEAGRHDAAVIHANFVAAGVGGPADWPRGLALLGALAERDRRCRAQAELIETMALTPQGDPRRVPEDETLSESPHIVRFEALFSPAECRYLIDAARPMLEPAVVIDNATGRQVRDPVRSSDGIGFTWPLENPAVHALNRRIAAASGTSVAQGEPLQVLRYRPGDQYRTHFDAIPGFSNQRAWTMLVWLNDDFDGGGTEFPAAGLSLRGRPGDAILFRNVGPDGRRDPATAHAGLPVARGEKLIASRWIRERPFEMPAGTRGLQSLTRPSARLITSVRPEPVEGPSLSNAAKVEGKGFDKLSPNGWVASPVRSGATPAPAGTPRRAWPASPDRGLREP